MEKVESSPKIKHNGRIVMRNLVFDISEKHIAQLLAPFGQVSQISILKKNGKNVGCAFAQFQSKNQALKCIKQLSGSNYKGRQIIIDIAVPKEKYKEQKKLQAQKEDLQMEQEPAVQIAPQPQIIAQTPQKPSVSFQDQDLSKTIFIKSIPFDCEFKEFKQYLQQYGDVQSLKLVSNKQTGQLTGTGFAKFKDESTCKQLCKFSKLFSQSIKNNKKKPISSVISLEFKGSILQFMPALKKNDIVRRNQQQQQAQMQRQRVSSKKQRRIESAQSLQELLSFDKSGKRRLQLALYGNERIGHQNKQNSQRRIAQKLQKLKNPNFIVSSSRVIVRGFPRKSVDQNAFKELIQNFVFRVTGKKAFKSIKFCKLIEQRDNKKRMGMNKGYGFVEFENEQLPLKLVKWCKEESQVELGYPLTVQFAIQDARKLRKIQMKSA